MEFRHLRAAVILAEELNFTRAANRLNITQPPLSLQIRQLEDEIGVPLFYRSKRHVQLTEAGRVFVEQARLLLTRAEDAAEAAAHAGRGKDRILALGALTSPDNAFYTDYVQIVRRFAKSHRDVHIALHSLNAADQIDALRKNQIHVGFVIAPPANHPELAAEIVRSEPLVAVLPKGHRLSNRRRVHLSELADEPLILPDRHTTPPCHDFFVRSFQAMGITPHIASEADNIQTSLTLVAAGVGVTLKPSSARNIDMHGIVFRELAPPVPRIQAGVIYRRDERSPLLTSFLETVRKVAQRTIEPGVPELGG